MIISADRRTVAVVLRLNKEEPGQPVTGPGSRAETFAAVRELAEGHDPPAAVAGEPLQVHDAFETVERDGRVLFYISLGLLSAVLLGLFRSVRWALIPLAVVLAAIWWDAGRVISVGAGAEHGVQHAELAGLYRRGGDRHARRRAVPGTASTRAGRQKAGPGGRPAGGVFAARRADLLELRHDRGGVLIAAVGGPHPRSRSFGLMMGVGAAAVLLGTFALTPGLALAGSFDTTPRDAPGEGLLGGLLGWGPGAILKYKYPIAVATALLTAASVAGVLRLKVETDFSKNFKADSPIVRSLDYFEERLGGAGSWEVNFPAPTAEEGLSDDYLAKVRSLAAALRGLEVGGEPAVTKVVALTDTLDTLPLPRDTVRGKLDMLKDFAPEVEPSLYDPAAGRMRIVLRSLERQPSRRKRAAIEKAEALAREAFPEPAATRAASSPKSSSSAPAPAATGLFVLLTYLIESLLRDQLVSFAWASAGIFAMMWAAFRSWKLALASMLPNLLPIGVVLGGLGWAGVPVNIGTAMIASVSVGLTVDGNVHYIAAYLRQRRAGATRRAALTTAHGTVGRAMTFAVLALACGFAALTFSQFVPLIYFGALVSLAMLGGLAGDLVLLPLMLGWRAD